MNLIDFIAMNIELEYIVRYAVITPKKNYLQNKKLQTDDFSSI